MRFTRPPNVNTSIAWSSDGTRLAFGSTDGTVRIEQVFQGGRGLRGTYYALNNLTGLRFFRLSNQINFNWAASSPEPNIRSQAAVIPVDNFSVRWTGFIEPLYTEAYTFFVNRNDGARLWVNGQQIINAWTNTTNAVETTSTAITLTAGVQVPITLEYYEATGNAQVSLSWQSARQTKQVVPTSALYAPRGQMAFVGTQGGNAEIYVQNPDGTGLVNLSNHAAADTNPIWSPDGTRVAWVSSRNGNPDIYMANADGTGLRQLTNAAQGDFQPAWSPDGRIIVFSSQRVSPGRIFFINVTGTGIPVATRLTANADTVGEELARFSPNGFWVSYESNANAFLIRFAATGARPTSIQLTTANGYDTALYWSPDGTRVALRAPCRLAGCTGDQIWVVNLTTLGAARLTTLGSNFFHSWSPDGNQILFLSTRDGNSEIYVMNNDGTAQTRLTNTTDGESYPIWSIDAREILYVRSSDLWLMNRDGSNQRRLGAATPRVETEPVWWMTHNPA
jgi:Tol biopolymer transport system component